MLRTVLWFFMAGLLAAMVIEFLWWMVGYYSPTGYDFERLSRVFWPSSVFKMALGTGQGSRFQTVLVYSFSFLVNGVLYGIFRVLASLARNLVGRQR